MTVHNKSNRRYKNTISTHTATFSRHIPIAEYIFITTPWGTSGTPSPSFNVYIFCGAVPTIWYPRVSYTLANLDVSRVRLFGSPFGSGSVYCGSYTIIIQQIATGGKPIAISRRTTQAIIQMVLFFFKDVFIFEIEFLTVDLVCF